MKLKNIIEEYIKYKKSMGFGFKPSGSILKGFTKILGDVPISRVTVEDVKAYLDSGNPSSRYWYNRYSVLKTFFYYCRSRGYIQSFPLPIHLPKQVEEFFPHVFTEEEYNSILDEIPRYKKVNHQFSCLAYETLVKLLFNTGLRISEALTVMIEDVDLQNNLITIQFTKFFKSRLVPISPQLSDSLMLYWEKEHRHILTANGKGPFFSKFNGMTYSRRSVADRFHILCKLRGIKHKDRRFDVRVHDIRHTFAVSRLLAWYKDGKDLNQVLPYLSTYLGHIELSSTQRYLSMTTELLKEANLKFEKYALGEEYYV